MRKVLYTLAASALVAALIPATALGSSHHRRHHARSHHSRTHHGVRHRQFGQSSDPTTPSMADNAGTVASFDGTTLVIKLADQSTVSGTVTGDTEIECQAADMSGTSFNSDDEASDQSGGSGDQSGGDQSGGSDDNGDNNDQGDDNDNDDNDAMQSCGPSSLTTGAIVHEAELSLTGAGAVWNKVELLTSSSSSSTSGSSTSSGDDD